MYCSLEAVSLHAGRVVNKTVQITDCWGNHFFGDVSAHGRGASTRSSTCQLGITSAPCSVAVQPFRPRHPEHVAVYQWTRNSTNLPFR